MREGIQKDMLEKDYREILAIHYSGLADFKESQDHCLIDKPAKSYFEEGTAFELLIEDAVKGTTKFTKRFFMADAPGDMPIGLAIWIDKKEDLASKIEYKLDGDRKKKSKHKWIDECLKNPGMMPMGTDQMEKLSHMVKNFLVMKPLQDIGVEETLEEILPIAQFQVPLFWNVGKMKKKALIDCMVVTDTAVYVFDTKTTATIEKFFQMARKRYWVQEIHYSSGIGRIFPGKDIHWRFLVAPKAEPWVTQPSCIDQTSVDAAWFEYQELCDRYQAWLDDGRPARGWKELETVKLYFK